VPLNILLADDSMTAQNMGKKILSEAGYEVTTVSNGAAALKKIADKTPDLVILDIYMPGYTGLEVCERVKRAAATSSMPVLLSVGKLEPYREQDATAVLADGVIVKPFEASELVTIVTNVILRASGANIDAATRPPTPQVAIQASPAAESKPLPAVEPVDYAAALVDRESQAQDARPAVTYHPATVSNGDYPGTSQSPQVGPGTSDGSRSGSAVPAEEKLLAMAVPATAAPTGPASFAAVSFGTTEENSSMPFMMDELLKAKEKAPEEDSGQRFAGPVLDVSPSEQATEEIEVIEIPAPEPFAGEQVSEEEIPLRHEAVPAEATAGGTDHSPEELTAIEVEAFLREHTAAAGAEMTAAEAEMASAGVDFDSDEHVQEGAAAIAARPDGSGTDSNELVPGASAKPMPPVEDQAAPAIAIDDNQAVFEAEDEPLFASTFTDAVGTAPIVEELAGQFDFEKAPTEPPAAVAEVSEEQTPEPQPASAALPTVMENEATPAVAATTEDFMFSVPMMLEGTAAMSLPELPDFAPAVAESFASSAFDSSKYAAEAARPAALDEAAIAEAVQRVVERFKPRIAAEIARELAKRKP
jgi:DNA-binding response OmpR family regulator